MLKRVPRPRREMLTERAREYVDPRLPVPLKAANRLLVPVAPRLWPIEPDVLKRKARERTALDGFGTDAPLDEPLEILCASLNNETELTPMGQLSIHTQLVNNLSHRLRLEELIRRHPEVLDVPVTAPVFIVGLPRSGTTLLQRLLSIDPAWRSAPFWEVLNPLPVGAPGEPVTDPDPRVKAGATALRLVHWTSPDLRHIHEMANDLADEEIPILAISHASSFYECMAMVPAYVDWYTAADHTAGYRYFRRFLQAMQWVRPGGCRWLLKAPSHLEMLRPLHTAFPDATVVQTHRDPVTSVISLSSLIAYGARANLVHPDPHLVGRFAADFVERLLRAADRDRAADDTRFVDVHYGSLVADPVGEVRRVCAAARAPVTEAVLEPMRRWLAGAGAHKGGHRYDAADFALDVPRLRERFAFYYERFGVRPDGR